MGRKKKLPDITKFLIKTSKPVKEKGPDPELQKWKDKHEELKVKNRLLKKKFNELRLKLKAKEDAEILSQVQDPDTLYDSDDAEVLQRLKITNSRSDNFGLQTLQQQIKLHELAGLVVRRADDNYLFTQFRFTSRTKCHNYYLKLKVENNKYSFMSCNVPPSISIKELTRTPSFAKNPKQVIRLIAQNCQVYENIRSQVDELKKQFGPGDNVNIFNTRNYTLINIQLPLISKSSGEVHRVEIKLDYRLTCCRPEEVTIDSDFRYSMPDDYFKTIKSQFQFFKTEPLDEALRMALADEENKFDFRWLTEDLDDFKEIMLFPHYPPPGYKYNLKHDKFVPINGNVSEDEEPQSNRNKPEPKTIRSKSTQLKSPPPAKPTRPRISKRKTNSPKPSTSKQNNSPKPTTSKMLSPPLNLPSKKPKSKKVAPNFVVPSKFLSSTPYVKKTVRNDTPNFSSISNVTDGKSPKSSNEVVVEPQQPPNRKSILDQILQDDIPTPEKPQPPKINTSKRKRSEEQPQTSSNEVDLEPKPHVQEKRKSVLDQFIENRISMMIEKRRSLKALSEDDEKNKSKQTPLEEVNNMDITAGEIQLVLAKPELKNQSELNQNQEPKVNDSKSPVKTTKKTKATEKKKPGPKKKRRPKKR